jgi:hypothetical protein
VFHLKSVGAAEKSQPASFPLDFFHRLSRKAQAPMVGWSINITAWSRHHLGPIFMMEGNRANLIFVDESTVVR